MSGWFERRYKQNKWNKYNRCLWNLQVSEGQWLTETADVRNEKNMYSNLQIALLRFVTDGPIWNKT